MNVLTAIQQRDQSAGVEQQFTCHAGASPEYVRGDGLQGREPRFATIRSSRGHVLQVVPADPLKFQETLSPPSEQLRTACVAFLPPSLSRPYPDLSEAGWSVALPYCFPECIVVHCIVLVSYIYLTLPTSYLV